VILLSASDDGFDLWHCSVIPKLGWIEGDWGGIIPSQACGGLNPSQSTLNPFLAGINEQGLYCSVATTDRLLFFSSLHCFLANLSAPD
jgi:hypothetical protein